MKILYVAYPLVPVTAQACGGAEQMLFAVEHGIARAGHDTSMAACAASAPRGAHIVTGEAAAEQDSFEQRDAIHNARVLHQLSAAREAGQPYDLVHDMGGSFWRLAAAVPEPVLLTAHLGREWYGDDLANAPNLFVNCVSASQEKAFADVPGMVGVVRNGIAFHRFDFRESKRDYLVWLGRICEEKAPHLAIDAARRAGVRIIVAGDVYNFSYHREYFRREVLSRLIGGHAQLLLRPSTESRAELLANARGVLVPSLVDETSSLVSMEAAASGTPVIAFRRGALPEVVVDGKTGFVVNSLEEMVAAVRRLPEIDPANCRRHAEENFDSGRMIRQYEALYWRVKKLHELSLIAAA